MKRALSALVLLGAGLSAGRVEAKPYKGAEVYTQSVYKYGRIEVRMRAARGSGILSTFFTYKQGSEMPGAAWEEIDVEIFGKSNAMAFQSNILVGNPRMGSEQEHAAATSLADGYHTYTVEWTPTTVVWLIDGVEKRRTTGGQVNQLLTAHNFRFNLWASDVSSWAGAFESSALPQYQYVNWIRYYRYDGGAFVLEWSDDFNSLDAARWSKANWTFDGNLADFDPNNAVVKDGTLVLCLTAEGQGGCSGAVPADVSGMGGMGGMGGGGQSGSAGSGGMGGVPSGGVGGAAGGSVGAGAGGLAGGSGGAGAGARGIATGGSGGALGGAAGAAGAAGTPPGATAGNAGSLGSGSGGSPVGAGGTNGGAMPNGSSADSGCGCAVVGKGGHGWLWLAFGLGLATWQRRARRR